MLVYRSVTSMDTLVWAFVKIVHYATQGCWKNKNNSPSLQELLECTVVMTHWPQWFLNHPDWLNVLFFVHQQYHQINLNLTYSLLLMIFKHQLIPICWTERPMAMFVHYETQQHKQPTWYGLVRANSLLRWSISWLGTSNTSLKY